MYQWLKQVQEVAEQRDEESRRADKAEAERDSLAAKLAVAREALKAVLDVEFPDTHETWLKNQNLACDALARIDGDGTEGFPPKQEDCPAEFLAVANTLEPLTSEGAGTEGKGG